MVAVINFRSIDNKKYFEHHIICSKTNYAEKVNDFIYNFINDPCKYKIAEFRVSIKRRLDDWKKIDEWKYKPTYR